MYKYYGTVRVTENLHFHHVFINSYIFQLNKKLIESVNIGGTENVIKGKDKTMRIQFINQSDRKPVCII